MIGGNKPVPVEGFGGLNTTLDHTTLGWNAAVALENVDFDKPGMVRTRDGLTRIGDADVISGTSVAGMIPVNYSGTDYMLVASTNTGTSTVYLDTLRADGTEASVGNWTSLTSVVGMVNIGTATSTITFVTSDGATLRKYDGTTLGTSVGKPRFAAVTPVSNRLVQAWFSAAADSPTGANGSKSTVFFSDAGAPETFGANNYVHLHPGDGEEIRGIVAWRELLFVFKRTKVFVFYGESTDASGNPVFNYRTIHIPIIRNPAASDYTPPPVAGAGQRGVYVVCGDGVYVSTGGEFTKVSAVLDATFRGFTPSVTGFFGFFCAAGRIFVLLGDDNFFTYVMDEVTGEWSYWTFQLDQVDSDVFPVVDWPAEFPYGRVFVLGNSLSVYRSSPTATADNGNAIPASYQSGWFAPSGAVAEVTVRETEITGTGTPQFSWARDFGSFDTAATVTLGTSPAVARGYHRVAKCGENLSFKISSSSGAWSVRRVTPMLREIRGAGEMTA